MEQLEIEKYHTKSKKGSNKRCTKNKEKHDLFVVKPNGKFSFELTKAEYMANLFALKENRKGNLFSRGATVSVCTLCGKIITKWN